MDHPHPQDKTHSREGDAGGRAPFRLAGSMELLVSAEELEAGIAAERARQAELFAARMRRWAEE